MLNNMVMQQLFKTNRSFLFFLFPAAGWSKGISLLPSRPITVVMVCVAGALVSMSSAQ